MRFIIPLWVNEGLDARAFDAHNPLSAMGEVARKRGWDMSAFTVFFIDGFHRLDAGYVARLRDYGFDVVDYGARFASVAQRYAVLNRFPRNEAMCFLRWVALKDYLDSENFRTPFVMADSDIIYNATPAEVFGALAGRTLMIQGGPGFTVISDYAWFDQYLSELDAFCADIEGYSADAWAWRESLSPEEWRSGSRERWVGGWRRQVISSDQDLIAYLARRGRLRQDDPKELIASSRLYFAENSLNLASHALLQLGKDKGLSFTSDGTYGYLEGRKVAYWHFQNGLRTWLNLVFILRRAGWKGRVPMHDTSRLAYWAGHATRYVLHMSRCEVIEHISEYGFGRPGSLSLADIFSDRTYWKPGVFA